MILWRVKSRSDRWYPSRSRRSWMGTDAGYSGLEQEDVSERRRTEDEEETLRMTQKVSNQYNSDNKNQMEWCESPTMTRLDEEVLWCWCLWRLRWWGSDDVQVCLESGAGVCCDWLGWRTDRSVTHVNMDQNLRWMFPTPCWIYATKN